MAQRVATGKFVFNYPSSTNKGVMVRFKIPEWSIQMGTGYVQRLCMQRQAPDGLVGSANGVD